MSKFIERLQQVFQPLPQSMGFQASQKEQARPKIQLIVNVASGKLKSPPKELDEADALVLTNSGVGVNKTVWGKWLSKGDADEVEKSIKSGADFVILPADGEVLPSDKKIGEILQIDASITDALLRTINELAVDAVLLNERDEGELVLTWKRMMLIQRFSSLLNKPLLIEMPANVTSNELQLVWEAGVSGVIVTVDAEKSEAVTRDLRDAVDNLCFPSKRKRGKNLAILPRLEIKPEEPEEDEGDDD